MYGVSTYTSLDISKVFLCLCDVPKDVGGGEGVHISCECEVTVTQSYIRTYLL